MYVCTRMKMTPYIFAKDVYSCVYNIHLHIDIHTYADRIEHIHIHTYLPTYLPTYLHTYIHTYTYTHSIKCMYIHSHPSIHPCIRPCILHACMHACMHACTYIHIHMCKYLHLRSAHVVFVPVSVARLELIWQLSQLHPWRHLCMTLLQPLKYPLYMGPQSSHKTLRGFRADRLGHRPCEGGPSRLHQLCLAPEVWGFRV